MKKITIIVLHFNGEEDTNECLKSLAECEIMGINLSVIVVDNGSDKKFEIRNSKFEIGTLELIRNNENLGFAGGNNVGIKKALEEKSDYILLLNNDTITHKNCLVELLKTAEDNLSSGILNPKIYFAKGHEYHKDRYSKGERGNIIWFAGGVMDWKNVLGFHKGVDQVDNSQFDKIYKMDYATGACMFVKKKVFEEIGVLDEKYFLYYEDSDFSLRAKKKGFSALFVPKAIVWHKNAGSSGGSGSALQDYYISRNRLLFGLNYAPFRSKISLIKESLTVLLSGRKWQKKGVMDFYLGKFGRGDFKFDN